jgi:carbamoyl-phosphate synthase large subunit
MPTVAITSDKYETARFAASIGVPAPETRLIESVRGIEDGGWIIKPRFGSSSVGLIVDARSADLDRLRFLGGDTPYVVQRRLRGPEYTVNFYVDRAGRCLEVVPHRRLATRSGEVSHGRTVAHPTLDAYTRKIAERLPGAYGALCAQFIDDAVMGCALIEINARFGGGYPLAHRAGARFPQHLVRDAAGMPADPASLWQPDWEMLRYDQSAFVPPGTT